MPDADFTEVLRELDALEAEIDAMRVAVDEGEETFVTAPAARQAALRHLDAAMRHAVGAARHLIDEADWEEPEDSLDAIEILAEEDVLPGRIGLTLVGLADYVTELGEESGYEGSDDPVAFERLSEGVDALAEFQEYVHQFLKEWAG
ncbi:MAG: HepT-like ribonuclease domain-containing protein [Gemmatimonadota bacterium]